MKQQRIVKANALQKIGGAGLIIGAILIVLALAAACAAPVTPTEKPAIDATIPAPAESVPSPAPTEALGNPKLPAASFESQIYINETIGFALDYPVQWTVNGGVISERGSQVRFLSSPEIAELAVLPEGATRVSVTVYQWDPKNDLAAFVAHQKNAWESSGFAILEEQELTLELGLPAVQFVIGTPDSSAVFLISAIGDQYVVISGEGDLELVKEIAQRLRPVSS